MDHEIFIESEERANRFNLRCFVAIICIALLVLFVNIIGVFNLPKNTVASGVALLIMYYSVPLIVYFIHDKLLKGPRKPILRNPKFKILLLACAFFGIIATILAVISILFFCLCTGNFCKDRVLNLKNRL